MLNPVVGMSLPAFTIAAFVAWKMPPKVKRVFFTIPIWISSTLIAIKIGHSMRGVLGPYSMLICDIVLAPAFWIMKWFHERKYGPVPTYKEAWSELKAYITEKFKGSTKPSFRLVPGGVAA